MHCIPYCHSEEYNQQVHALNGKEPVSGIVKYNTRSTKKKGYILTYSCRQKALVRDIAVILALS